MLLIFTVINESQSKNTDLEKEKVSFHMIFKLLLKFLIVLNFNNWKMLIHS